MSKCGEGLHTYSSPHNSEGADRLDIGKARPKNLRMFSIPYFELEKKHEGKFFFASSGEVLHHSNPNNLPVNGSERDKTGEEMLSIYHIFRPDMMIICKKSDVRCKIAERKLRQGWER